jgi:hypothetical protein
MVASLLDLAGLNWSVPDFSTLCHSQKTLNVQIPYCPASGALHLLIGSMGVDAEGDSGRLANKHGPSKPRDWRKVHLGIDADTLQNRAISIIGSRIGDAPILPDLLDQIPDGQRIGLVTADSAYDTRTCAAAIAARGDAAVMPPSKNRKPWKKHTAGAYTRNDALRRYQPLLPGYLEAVQRLPQPHLVEAKMGCFKLLGERIMSHNLYRQGDDEHQIRAAILNCFSAPGTPLTQCEG